MDIVLASNNQGKVTEFQQLLAEKQWTVYPQSHFNIPSPDETGLTFVENALLKARHASKLSGLPALADDSGLAVDYLNGAPGIYSARFAGTAANDQDNNAKLVSLLQDVPETQRTAHYHCALVFLRHAADPTPLICMGKWSGFVQLSPKGSEGFGYDPHMYFPDLGCTAAELKPEIKNAHSHRGRAMQHLLALL